MTCTGLWYAERDTVGRALSVTTMAVTFLYDFLSTPFMMFWPGVFHGYRIAALSGEVKLDGGGESTCATTIASSSKSKSTAQVDEYYTEFGLVASLGGRHHWKA